MYILCSAEWSSNVLFITVLYTTFSVGISSRGIRGLVWYFDIFVVDFGKSALFSGEV